MNVVCIPGCLPCIHLIPRIRSIESCQQKLPKMLSQGTLVLISIMSFTSDIWCLDSAYYSSARGVVLDRQRLHSNNAVRVYAGAEAVAHRDGTGAAADVQACARPDVPRNTAREPHRGPERAAASQPHSTLNAAGHLQPHRR